MCALRGCAATSDKVCVCGAAAVSDGVYAVDSGYVGVHVVQLGFSGKVCAAVRGWEERGFSIFLCVIIQPKTTEVQPKYNETRQDRLNETKKTEQD